MQTQTETRGSPVRRSGHSVLIAVVGGLWIAAGALGPLSDSTLGVLALAAIAALLVGIRRFRPPIRWPWYLFTVGQGLFLLGGIARTAQGTLGDLSADRSLVPDLITIPGYVVASIALLGIVRARQRSRDVAVDTLLDATVAALACLTLGWLFVVNPGALSETPLANRIVLAIYPTLSVFLVAITATLIFSSGNRRLPANAFLVGSTISVLVGDVAYMFVETNGIKNPPGFVNLPYAVAYLFVVLMALHPSFREVTDEVPESRAAPTIGRLVTVAVALAIPGLLTVTKVDAPIGDRVMLAATVLSLTAAAIARLFRALRAHARSEARLSYQATHDMLTGLPNRAYVQAHLDEALRDSPPGSVALLFCDVDRFKLVNDSHGHSLGDQFLLAVAQRLRASIRPTDLVARIGGDEFVLVAHQIGSEREAIELAQRMRRLFSEPFEVLGAELTSSVSIGITMSSGEADAESMIRDADTAMYAAKDSGRDAVTIFDSSMRERVSARLDLERDLHHALARGELEVNYQPIVDMASGRLRGFEALLRWQHPRRGTISPAQFIPVAEETGLISDIGAWTLREACAQLARWRTELPRGEHLTVAVNLSARQLRDHRVLRDVREAYERAELDPGALTVELTESSLMENPDRAAELLNRLRALGVHLAIDDFGTGYSSLAYLRKLPVDVVKIDRVFVMNLDDGDTADASLIAAIVAMADALGIGTVAEGVETEAQASNLLQLGCTVAQGYLYSRPHPSERIPDVARTLATRARSRLRPVQDAFSA